MISFTPFSFGPGYDRVNVAYFCLGQGTSWAVEVIACCPEPHRTYSGLLGVMTGWNLRCAPLISPRAPPIVSSGITTLSVLPVWTNYRREALGAHVCLWWGQVALRKPAQNENRWRACGRHFWTSARGRGPDGSKQTLREGSACPHLQSASS